MLHYPPRLLSGIQFGTDNWVSIEYGGVDRENRTIYRYYIDTPQGEYTGNDLKSGCQGGSLQSGLESLLSFLGAWAEALQYSVNGRRSENIDLFPEFLQDFALQYSDEISTIAYELFETPNIIEE